MRDSRGMRLASAAQCAFGARTRRMFGLTNDVAKFFVYVFVMVLVTQAGASLLLLIGALSKSMAMGNALATIVLVFASLFNGFFIHPDNVPIVYRWISDISFPAFGVKAAVTNEFTSLVFACTSDEAAAGAFVRACAPTLLALLRTPPGPVHAVCAGCTGSGDALLRSLGFGHISIVHMCVYLFVEIAVFRVLALLCMHFMYTGQPFKERARLLWPGL